MEKIYEILTDFNDEEDVRDLWEEIFHLSDGNKYSAHNLIMGFPQKGDTILWQQMISKVPNTMGWATDTICYPPEQTNHLPDAVITGIAVIDVKNDKKGGTAEIKSGGVGAQSVKIRLNASFWRGISFQVIIIGKYLKNINELKDNLTNDKIESKDKNI